MTHASFDHAAGDYDATRGYAAGSAERIRDAILAYTGATQQSRFLELGVGTGRIALPFIHAGYNYTGVDISRPMMLQLEAKLAEAANRDSLRYELYEGDITSLPFADAHFEIVIAVHVLHLLADWQAAVREARRVLAPGGWLLVGYDQRAQDAQPGNSAPLPAPLRVRAKWSEIRRELGLAASGEAKFLRLEQQLPAYLHELGAEVEIVRLAEIERPPIAPRDFAERLTARTYSSDWQNPDVLHAEASRRLDEWLVQAIEAPDIPVAYGGYFVAIAATWPVSR
jgi:SAM-dependent methyltransferase